MACVCPSGFDQTAKQTALTVDHPGDMCHFTTKWTLAGASLTEYDMCTYVQQLLSVEPCVSQKPTFVCLHGHCVDMFFCLDSLYQDKP